MDMADCIKLEQDLNQYTGLFNVYAEEDPGYRQVQLLQDAGIIPVHGMGNANPSIGERPRGVSSNIPQHVIDDMLREDGLGEQHQMGSMRADAY